MIFDSTSAVCHAVRGQVAESVLSGHIAPFLFEFQFPSLAPVRKGCQVCSGPTVGRIAETTNLGGGFVCIVTSTPYRKIFISSDITSLGQSILSRASACETLDGFVLAQYTVRWFNCRWSGSRTQRSGSILSKNRVHPRRSGPRGVSAP